MSNTLTKDPKLLAKLEATRIRHGLPPTVYEQELIQLMILDQMEDAKKTEIKKHPHMEEIKGVIFRSGRKIGSHTLEERQRTSERYKLVKPWLYSKPSEKSREAARKVMQQNNSEGKTRKQPWLAITPQHIKDRSRKKSRRTRATVIELYHKVWHIQYVGTVDDFLTKYPDINIMQITKMIKDPKSYPSYHGWKMVKIIFQPPN